MWTINWIRELQQQDTITEGESLKVEISIFILRSQLAKIERFTHLSIRGSLLGNLELISTIGSVL